MSILNSSYEISVWLDKLVGGTFQEERVCVIGSDTMLFDGRAIEPRLTRNINGEKKFSFKMYKRFVDTITGEEVENPFSEYLVNEAKVKLYYKDKWYDFYVKNVVENSSTYLYSYELADANVQELSKNGYGVIFDAELMNNLGTAQELASKALEDTGWTVESEVFVEKVVDNLVYIRTTKEITNVCQVKDQTELSEGVDCNTIVTIPEGKELLGFYSSCKNKPHRFQFIYLVDGYAKDKVQLDQDNNIINADCQYYIDVPSPQTGYKESDAFYLPSNFQVINKTGVSGDTTISTWYKAKRYGFAQKTKYIPLLNRYCNIYKNSSGIEYYGYLDSEYTSPVLITNAITNSEFKGNTGWTGTYIGPEPNQKNIVGAKVESICGRFNGTVFQSAMDDLQNGTYNANNTYVNYLQVEFPEQQSGCAGILINSGFYDNRHQIQIPQDGEEWCFEAEIKDNNGAAVSLNSFSISLADVEYNSTTGGYQINSSWTDMSSIDTTGCLLTFNDEVEGLTENSFKNKTVKLVIQPKETSGYNKTYYIKSISLYKKYIDATGTGVIKPGELSTDGTIVNNYIFIPSSQLTGTVAKTDEKELSKTIVEQSELNYSIFIPQYNEGAAKVRTIAAKESNYFNILQTIAETFECWMDIIVSRDANGGINSKTIKFKNFTGDDNYACFRYGVNLKDIQRTYESKQLTTKLIVKQNNNQLAKNGFCTIARSGSNPTGENYIYDFQYYHKTGLLDATSYQAAMYYHTNPLNGINAAGPDIAGSTTTNLQNYFNRIKSLNDKMEPINEDLIDLNMDLLKLKADLTIQEGLVDAAESGMEEAQDEFFNLVGFYPEEVKDVSLSGTQCLDGTQGSTGDLPAPYESKYDYKNLNGSIWNFEKNDVTIRTIAQGKQGSSLKYSFRVDITPRDNSSNDTAFSGIEIKELVGYAITQSDDFKLKDYNKNKKIKFKPSGTYGGITIIPQSGYQKGSRYKLTYTIKRVDETNMSNVGSHPLSFKDWTYKISWSAGGTTHFWPQNGFKSGNLISLTGLGIPDKTPINVIMYGTYNEETSDYDQNRAFFIQPNRGLDTNPQVEVSNITLSRCTTTSQFERKFYISPVFKITTTNNNTTYRHEKVAIPIEPYKLYGHAFHTYEVADFSTTSCSKAFQEYATCKQQRDASSALVASLQESINLKESAIATKQSQLKQYSEQKEILNKLFYSQYHRFIQEGTWMSEDYADDDKYYNDSLAVLYNSCYPQVAYNINIIALNKLPGYEGFNFDIGENTYVEDPDFLGKDTSGNDIRVRVAITEMTEALDDPTQDNIKVQNFKNDFADLFHKITATVQQTQYNTGAYEKAVELAEADAELKSAFLQSGLQSMDAVLSVGGQDTVVSDTDGITITDSNTKNQLRLVGGAILLGVEDNETGLRKWKTGLTPDGINASLIQAGTVNTGIINIMNATEPTFKWDSFGISAYDVDWTGGAANGQVNTGKFVRYDKYGLYGIDSELISTYIDGSSWYPSNIDEIKQEAQFALTWDGLFLKLGSGKYSKGYITNDSGTGSEVVLPNPITHISTAVLGKMEDRIYNTWTVKNLPSYDAENGGVPFVKIFSVADSTKSEKLAIYDDGTLVANKVLLTGSIEWTEASSPSKSVYGKTALKDNRPADGTSYSTFEKDDSASSPRWHKVADQDDTYYCHTDDGGGTWQGPFLITGKSILETEIKYGTAIAGTVPANVIYNNNSRPTNVKIGHNIYIRMIDKFNNGTQSSPRYTIDGGRAATVELTSYAATIPAGEDGTVDTNLLKSLSLIEVKLKDGTEYVTDWTDITITWSVTNGTLKNSGGGSTTGNQRMVYLSAMSDNSTTVTVNVSMGSMDFGSKTFTISKSIQGKDAVMVYLTSSAGTAFEARETGITTLTAYVLRNGTDITDSNWTYEWYYEQGSTDSRLKDKNGNNANGKTVEVNKSALFDKRVYFIAKKENS